MSLYLRAQPLLILVGTTETRREEVTWPQTRRELAAGPEVEVSSHTPRFSNLTKAGWALTMTGLEKAISRSQNT